MGTGLVVHYGGLVRGLRAGPIEVVSIEQLTQGRPLRTERIEAFGKADICIELHQDSLTSLTVRPASNP
jgi:hypothetical protein